MITNAVNCPVEDSSLLHLAGGGLQFSEFLLTSLRQRFVQQIQPAAFRWLP